MTLPRSKVWTFSIKNRFYSIVWFTKKVASVPLIDTNIDAETNYVLCITIFCSPSVSLSFDISNWNLLGQDNGYSSGAMAALGIIMLLLTIGGVVALLILVLKWWRDNPCRLCIKARMREFSRICPRIESVIFLYSKLNTFFLKFPVF